MSTDAWSTRRILAELNSQKIAIRLEEGTIYLRPESAGEGAGAIPPELAAAIRRRRPEILWLLERRTETGAPWEIWLRGRHWEEWRLISHRFWTAEEATDAA